MPECLNAWATAQAATLPDVLSAASKAPTRTGLQALIASFPKTAVEIQEDFGFDRPPTWPASALDVEARTMVANVAARIRSQHEVVHLKVRDNKGLFLLPSTKELSRSPAILLSNGTVITPQGDVFVQKYSGGRTAIFVKSEETFLVSTGGQPRLRNYQELSLGGWGNDSEPAHYRDVQGGTRMQQTTLWLEWRNTVLAMANALP